MEPPPPPPSQSSHQSDFTDLPMLESSTSPSASNSQGSDGGEPASATAASEAVAATAAIAPQSPSKQRIGGKQPQTQPQHSASPASTSSSSSSSSSSSRSSSSSSGSSASSSSSSRSSSGSSSSSSGSEESSRRRRRKAERRRQSSSTARKDAGSTTGSAAEAQPGISPAEALLRNTGRFKARRSRARSSSRRKDGGDRDKGSRSRPRSTEQHRKDKERSRAAAAAAAVRRPPASSPSPAAAVSEYEQLLQRLQAGQRDLLRRQHELERDIRSELDSVRRGKARKVEKEGEALDFVNQFLLARGPAAAGGGAAALALSLFLKRDEEEKRRDRQRRQRQLQGGSDDDDDEEEEQSDLSQPDDEEDEDEAGERRRRHQQRQQRRHERSEARQRLRQQRQAQRDAATVDDTQSFLHSLTIADPLLQQQAEEEKTQSGDGQTDAAGAADREAARAAERRRHEMGEPLQSVKAEPTAAALDAPTAPALNFCFYGVEQEDWEQRIQWQEDRKREEEESEQKVWEERRRKGRIAALQADETVASASASASASSSSSAGPQQLSFSTFSLPSLSSLQSSSSSRPAVRLQWLKQASAADRQRWEQHVSRERRQRMQERFGAAASSAALSSEWRGLVLTSLTAAAADERSAAAPSLELPRRLNPSLLTAEWEAAIVWDESVLVQRRELLRHHHALLLDQNDPQLLLPPTKSLLHLPPPAASSLPWSEQRRLYDVSQDVHYALEDFRSSVSHLQKTSHAAFAVNLDPAVYRTRTKPELEQYHRPLLTFTDDAALPVLPADLSASVMAMDDQTARYVPSTLEDMSATDGELLLCEYLERFPPLLLDAGMSSAVVTYYCKKDDNDNFQPHVKVGDAVVLRNKKDESPFLSELRPGQQVTALNNGLFIAPIHRHDPPANTFLLIRAAGSGSSWSVRPLPHCYIVGQEEPKLLIPPPGSQAAQELLRKQIEAWVWRRFRDELKDSARGRAARLLLSDVISEFGNDVVVEALAKKVLREAAAVNAATQEYYLRDDDAIPSEEKLAALCTPEDVCVYDSMLAADHRLKQELGIRHLISAKQISAIIDHLTEPDVSRRACYIEKQLHLTPWSLTAGLFAYRSGKGRLLLHGRGNPFADGCGVSFINEKDIKSGEDDGLPVIAEPKKKTGTNADLRKLTMEEMATALVRLGMGEEEVRGLARWDRVRAMARLSKQAAEEGQFPNLSRFARQSRQSNAEKEASFKQQLQQIFDRQLAMLRSTDRPDYKHEINDDPAAVKKGENMGKDMAALRTGKGEVKKKLSTAQQKRRQEKDEEREYQDFLAERERSIKQAAAKQQQGDKERKEQQQANRPSAAAASPSIAAGGPAATAAAAGGGAAAASTSSSSSSAGGSKRKKKVLITKLQHVIKVTNPDGTQSLRTELYDDVSILKDYLLDLSDGGRRLRSRLIDNGRQPLPAATDRKDRKEEDDDAARPKGEPKVELVPVVGRPKIRTLEGIRNSKLRAQRGARAGAAAAAAGRKRRRTRQAEIDSMFELDDEDVNRPSNVFSFPSPSAASPSFALDTLVKATPSGTLKLSRRQIEQTPQDIYISKSRKRKTEDAFASSSASVTQQQQSSKRKAVSSRRRGDPRIHLSACLEDIVSEVSAVDYSAPFREPVTAQQAPDYEDVIEQPMDLRSIRGRCGRMEYDSKEEFMRDISLIVRNCEVYNGADTEISHFARMMAEDVQQLLDSDAYRDRIIESEAGIAQHRLLVRLEACIKDLAGLPDAGIFAHTPNWAEYLQRVSTPISLDVLRERVANREYETAGEFLHDVKQMYDNSVLYNGSEHHVTRRAEQMLHRAREYLDKHFTAQQLQPSDALVLRKAREKPDWPTKAAADVKQESRASTAATQPPVWRTPALKAEGGLTTPRLGEAMPSPAPSPRMSPRPASPVRPTPQTQAAATPASSSLPVVQAAPSALSTPVISSGASMTPFTTAASASASSPLAVPSVPTSAAPSPSSRAAASSALPALPASSSSSSSSSAFLPASTPADLQAADHDDVLSSFGDLFGAEAAGAGGTVGGDLDGGLGLDMGMGLDGMDGSGLGLEEDPSMLGGGGMESMRDDADKKDGSGMDADEMWK